MASFMHAPFDKENNSGTPFSLKNTKNGKSINPLKQQMPPLLPNASSASAFANDCCTTPVVRQDLKSKAFVTTTAKRRALGDVLNTATTKKHTVVNRQMTSGLTPAHANKISKQHMIETIESPLKKMCLSTNQDDGENCYEPIEHCYNDSVDTFRDLFEETGKISELFIQPNVFYVPKLPCGFSTTTNYSDENVMIMSDLNDKKLHKQIKNINRSIKKRALEPMSLEHREMAIEELDEFKIPVDF